MFPCYYSQSNDAIDTVLLMKSVYYGFWSFALVFCTCELGQQFSNILEKVTDDFNRLDWHSFPIEMQRMLPLIFVNVQKDINVGCFGIIIASRQQFKKVRNIWKLKTSNFINQNSIRWLLPPIKDLMRSKTFYKYTTVHSGF